MPSRIHPTQSHHSANILQLLFGAAALLFAAVAPAQESAAVALPPGAKAVWDADKAARETTSTRERLCINGLWRWQPASAEAREVPKSAWGYFKVPACWPGIQDYMQSDYQTLYTHPSWKDTNLAQVQSAWYERAVTIPQGWTGRRILLEVEYLNSFATVFVDGREVGQFRFPAGQLDLTDVLRPGATHLLSIQVVALPLKGVMESYTDTNSAKQRKGTVERRGLCGDAWLVSEPPGPRLGKLRIDTSFRKTQLRFTAETQGLLANGRYKLKARILDSDKSIAEFTGPAFSTNDLTTAQASLTADWKAPRLWDIHAPENQYTAELSLIDADGRVLDTALPVRFGFREFWTEGRDFYLNGTRLYLSIVPLDNASIGAALATYDAAKESFLRLKSFGINFVYGHNYGCEPGSHLSFSQILRAADDTGMLVALSQPHFSAYDWKAADADRNNGYATHAAFYVQVAGSHPSVVSYAMSHNATGYNEDMNPAKIDGLSNPRDQWASRNAVLAVRCEKIVKQLDPGRLVYHHSSGSLSGMHTINFYPNFVPIQEMDDWFEHWSTAGVEPVLLVEFGAPFGWDWTMYRGWFEGKREFGSADAPWEYCVAEWDAQFLGDAAYQISEREKRNIRWEAQQFSRRKGWRRWDYPVPVGDVRMEEIQPIQAAYTTSNWRAFRTWGLSGNSPWEHNRFWMLRPDFQPQRKDLPVDWDSLQRPGYSPDYIDRTYARFDLAYERSDWIPTPTAQALKRNNMPVLAWIAGKEEHFTVKDHNYYPGETAAKQLIIINNSRVTITGEAAWSCDAQPGFSGTKQVTVPTGEQVRIPLPLNLPANQPPGGVMIKANFRTSGQDNQSDSFALNVVPRPAQAKPASRIALFDPSGETKSLLSALGVSFQSVEAKSDLAGFDILLIGKGALTVDRLAPALDRVRDGLKVVVFEQTADTLEKRLGFRVAEYGLRQVWPRLPDSPLLAGLTAADLRDWRGGSTLIPPAVNYTLSPRYNGAPSVQWCGIEVTRLWRCGTRGNVASVLIEKPPRGDFLPILEGGYALQYSPLLEYREGSGLVLFCQMDVTARTENDPAAEILLNNLLRYVDAWRPSPHRTAVYAGELAGQEWLEGCGIKALPFKGQSPGPDQVLVVSPGAGKQLGGSGISDWIKAGGQALAIGLDETEAAAFLPVPIHTRPGEHIASHFPPAKSGSLLAGVSPADVHNRDPRTLPLVQGEIQCGDGVLACSTNVIFFQLRPWAFDHSTEHFNQRRTYARTSFAASRLLANLGVSARTPLLERFANPGSVGAKLSVLKDENVSGLTAARWLEGLYLTKPSEWDDPYRFFRW